MAQKHVFFTDKIKMGKKGQCVYSFVCYRTVDLRALHQGSLAFVNDGSYLYHTVIKRCSPESPLDL